MAPSPSRRKSLEPDESAKKPFLPTSTIRRASFSFLSSSQIFIFLLLLAVWCIFFRNLGHPHSAPIYSHIPISTNQDVGYAVYSAFEQARAIRSWSSETSKNNSLIRSCEGRGVFVYDLPPKFNKDILARCSDILPWASLCDLLNNNEGMGKPVPELGKGCYTTCQFSLEIIFHSRILNHPCRVRNAEDATVFYVPFYGGLDTLGWHFKNVSNGVKDALVLELVRWLESQWPWPRNAGRDHMFVLGLKSYDFRRREQSSWGSNFLLLEQMQAPYKFLIERQPWEIMDIGVPYPTQFHPRSDGDIVEWQAKVASSARTSFVTFAADAGPGVAGRLKSVLVKNCLANTGDCRLLDCTSDSCTRPEVVNAALMESEFCLQPPMDSLTTKSFFDSLVFGCIPVLFSEFTADYQYPWHLPERHRRYSVFIGQDEVAEGKVDVVKMLKKVTLEKRKEMRRFIVYELLPGLVYGDPSSEFVRFRDAFGIVMDNVIDLIRKKVK